MSTDQQSQETRTDQETKIYFLSRKYTCSEAQVLDTFLTCNKDYKKTEVVLKTFRKKNYTSPVNYAVALSLKKRKTPVINHKVSKRFRI